MRLWGISALALLFWPVVSAAAGAPAAVGAPAAGGAQQGRPETPPAPTPAASAGPAEVSAVITQEGGRRIPLAIPPAIAPIDPVFQAQTADRFDKTLASDLGFLPNFILADSSLFPKGARPPATKEQGDAWSAAGAQFLVDTQVQPNGEQVTVTAQLYDVRTLKPVLSKRYQAGSKSIRVIAHYLANDIVRQFFGQPGPFMTSIVFTSDRDSRTPKDGRVVKEVYMMDFDGENQTRLTYQSSLSMAPDITRDGSKIFFQSFYSRAPGSIAPGIFSIGREGGQPKQVPLSTGLNASPSISPDGKSVVFAGSIKGNPEIFSVNLDGGNLKRLTESASIDSTPRWAPNGREIAFTSNRQGSPQIYLMDSEGANVRRVTMAGNWNDEAAFSPKGDKLAFSCRNEGDFQICVTDMASGRTFQISNGGGSHENPTWSPDGSRIAWQMRKNGSTQIVSANIDGSGLKTLTSLGNNYSPVWSKALD